jgi:hypothetical protein
MQHMARAAMRDHDAQDQKLRRLLNYAVALEKELEQAGKGMEEVALAAAHDAEERTLLQYQQALLEFERAHEEHEAEAHAVEASLRAEVKRLHDLLYSAHGAKKQWRERALSVGGILSLSIQRASFSCGCAALGEHCALMTGPAAAALLSCMCGSAACSALPLHPNVSPLWHRLRHSSCSCAPSFKPP